MAAADLTLPPTTAQCPQCGQDVTVQLTAVRFGVTWDNGGATNQARLEVRYVHDCPGR